MVASSRPKKAMTTSVLAKKPLRPTKPNASILSFFQKSQRPEESLFVGAADASAPGEDIYGRDDGQRFNESTSPVKKRKVDDEHHITGSFESPTELQTQSPLSSENDESNDKRAKHRLNLPFVMDSDSEEEDEDGDPNNIDTAPTSNDAASSITERMSVQNRISPTNNEAIVNGDLPTNMDDDAAGQSAEFGDFDELDDLDLEEFEGEEFREMRFMREQARLEAEEAGTSFSEEFGDQSFHDDSMAQNCPICNGSLQGVSVDEATRHVNSCLDGNPIPLPETKPSALSEDAREPAPEVESVEISKRFARAAVPRPGQKNPFELENDGKAVKSAFSKLMSNNVEDSAWASAAAAENATRGRPAYERTCPFYKIIPGFNICVDAFRYGAVKGCEAYFLSHFHSDHYIGLTANWVHGPIYCSNVTASLVKKQLRTAEKWVVGLEFEKTYDIPGTGGATVTMIPANHCPGSSLFLFQKPAEGGVNRRGKRILHCGDFRACPAHVSHPLLRPDMPDSVTGKLKQQIIDICYLDTTYLNPRYSFPPQDDVIKACADLCASLSPDPNCKDDIWEEAAKEAGTQAVSKYFQSGKPTTETEESKKPKLGQRLLVICGTYSIGKERICVAIAKALRSKIFATPAKMRLCKQLDDPELLALLTSDAVEAQVHMQSLMEIRAETLQEYLDSYRPHFSRIVGFRPSGWNFRPPNGKAVGANTPPSSIPTHQVLHGKGWRTRFEYRNFVAQRGSTKEAMCFGVPYSEHSSFRELAMFIMSLRIEKVIPTVNVGSETSRKRMKGWLDRWSADRRRGGLLRPLIEGEDEAQVNREVLWDGKSGKGGGAYW